jgi:ubiquinone/menaquinone biosynthesis C-methylase UbiE
VDAVQHPDASEALKEMRRVLKPGGPADLHRARRSPDALVGKWQDRLTPLSARLAGGCHVPCPVCRSEDVIP